MTTQTRRRAKAVALLGYLAAAAGLFLAHASPADSYELSLYTGTPLSIWLCLVVAVLFGVGAWVYAPQTVAGRAGVALVGLTVLTVVGMPLIRGYHFYGYSDALNHLGFARKMASGYRSFFSYIYPGGHTFAITVSDLFGWELPRAMMFVVLTFVGLFITFVPLAVRLMMPDIDRTHLAAFAAFLVMPINNLSTTLQFHSFTLATLCMPLFFYLFLSHVTNRAADETLPLGATAVSLLSPLVGFALLMFHPLALLDAIVIVGATAGVQVFFRVFRSDSPLGRTKAVYGQFLAIVVMWWVWSSQHFEFRATRRRTMETLMELLSGSSQTAPEMQSTAQSAQRIGIDIPMLVAKLLSIEIAFLVLSAGLVVLMWLGVVNRMDTKVSSAVTYFGLGGLAMLPIVIVQLHGDISHLFFRHLGFAMVVSSMLGAICLHRIWASQSVSVPVVDASTLRPLAVAAAVIIIAASVVTLFPSPYIYLFNHHVTDEHMAGYEATYETQPDGGVVWYGSLRTGDRYKTAMASKPGTSWYPGVVQPAPRFSGPVPESAMIQGLPAYYESHPEEIVRRDHYLPVSQFDYEREVVSRDSLAYSEQSFRSVGTTENVHHVQSNGEFDVYYVDLQTPEAGIDAPQNE